MKKILSLCILVFSINSYAQNGNVSAEKLYEDGVGYLRGITKSYNPKLAKSLLYQSAKLEYLPAMNELGNIYSDGMNFKRNIDSAILWYKKAVFFGYGPACYNIANLYRLGFYIQQDFSEAFKYYAKGMQVQNAECKRAVAYMYYKGLGITQSYFKAFNLYKEIAEETGNVKAMYFLGICYRNGYGTLPNLDLAKNWLHKASNKYEKQAMNELNEEVPENVSAISPDLQNELRQLKTNVEKFRASPTNNYEGIYTGYAIYYDWSGEYVSDIQPLTLQLTKNKNSYSGNWKEGTSKEALIKMTNNGSRFKFTPNCNYTRVNHYSGRQPETWFFNDASMDLAFNDDSVVLSGSVRFYSDARREPGKPIQIILKKVFDKTNENSELVKLVIFPNPSSSETKVQFTVSTTSRISLKMYSQTGALIYSSSEKRLPAGTYTYDIPTTNLSSGAYNIQILVNDKSSATKTLIKQ